MDLITLIIVVLGLAALITGVVDLIRSRGADWTRGLVLVTVGIVLLVVAGGVGVRVDT